MNNHDIELPPLPPLCIAPSVEPVDYPEIAQALMDYARAAIEADRQRRGEPVAWIRKNGFRFISEIEPQDDSEVPLYAAPQPAEPVKVPSEAKEALWKAYESLRELEKRIVLDANQVSGAAAASFAANRVLALLNRYGQEQK